MESIKVLKQSYKSDRVKLKDSINSIIAKDFDSFINKRDSLPIKTLNRKDKVNELKTNHLTLKHEAKNYLKIYDSHHKSLINAIKNDKQEKYNKLKNDFPSLTDYLKNKQNSKSITIDKHSIAKSKKHKGFFGQYISFKNNNDSVDDIIEDQQVFYNKFKPAFLKYIKELFNEHNIGNIKIFFSSAVFMKYQNQDTVQINLSNLEKKVNNRFQHIYYNFKTNLNKITSLKYVNTVIKTINDEIQEKELKGSGWRYIKMKDITFKIFSYKPLKASNYIPTPKYISNKAVFNPMQIQYMQIQRCQKSWR